MTQVNTRIGRSEYEHIAPATVVALRALGTAVDDSGLEKPLTELLKVRASQLNGCAYCLNFHLAGARGAEVAPAKLDLIATWREVDVFTARERAALAWTESLTLMARQPVADSIFEELRQLFSASEIAYLTAAIGLINAWNRIAGGLRFAPSSQSWS
jgi:AhpD family alkylhydroperoxidase